MDYDVILVRHSEIALKSRPKDVPWTSPEINRLVGGYVKDETGATVDLKNAELNIGIEIINGWAYVFREVLPGPGGLPVGAAGRVLHLFCKTGSAASRIAEDWRKKGIVAYALDERTYRRLIM